MEIALGLLGWAVGIWLFAVMSALCIVVAMGFCWYAGKFIRWCFTVTYHPRRR